MDTDNGWDTTKIIAGLNTSAFYQFRVRASSFVPGEWSKPVRVEIVGDGEWTRGKFGWLPQWVGSEWDKASNVREDASVIPTVKMQASQDAGVTGSWQTTAAAAATLAWSTDLPWEAEQS